MIGNEQIPPTLIPVPPLGYRTSFAELHIAIFYQWFHIDGGSFVHSQKGGETCEPGSSERESGVGYLVCNSLRKASQFFPLEEPFFWRSMHLL